MLVFDVTSRQSFERVRDWLSEVERHASPECRLMLLGNKSDLVSRRCVTTEEAQQLAKELAIPFLETSAKDSTNVVDAFFGMAREMHRAKVQKGAECTKPRVVCAPANSKQLAANRSSWSSWCSIL